MKIASKNNKLNTIEGVYVPTLLTILGVIMYLRLGWIVGNVGIYQAVIIIILAHIITIATSLSMSTMLTNIKIGPGGAYSIITQSLGMEMGGAIGIPLFLSQTISSAFYITGFTELWTSFFPDHDMKIVGALTWVVLAVISVISAKLAFRIQYFILFAVFLSLVSFFAGPAMSPDGLATGIEVDAIGFWVAFAIFFPAVTGILTGATMSGELKNPGKSIIRGTLASVFTGFGAYLFIAFWFARQASSEELVANTNIILSLARYESLVVAGVMGAVLSSTLSTLVSAPRTLNALAANRIVPFSKTFSKVNKRAQPFNAIVFASLISLGVIVAGNLDSLAELLTMFFLTTYGMINLVVLIEQGTGITSFRPSLRMSIFVPVIGFVGCFTVMILINPIFSIITFITVITIYTLLKRRNISSPYGDVRASVFVAITEWAAQKIMKTPFHPRIWKPAIIIPAQTTENFERIYGMIRNLVFPSGRIYYLTAFSEKLISKSQNEEIDRVLNPVVKDKIFVQKILIGSKDFASTIRPVLQSVQNSFLPPNTIIFTISQDPEKRRNLKHMLESIRNIKISVLAYYMKDKQMSGNEMTVGIWLREGSPNNDLAVLYALQLYRNSRVQINLCRAITNENQRHIIEKEMKDFIEDARLPGNTEILIYRDSFENAFTDSKCDLSIIGMPQIYSKMEGIIDIAENNVLFVSSKGMENILV